MCFFHKFIALHKEKVKKINLTCDNYIFRTEKALQELLVLFSDTQNFIEPNSGSDWCTRHSVLISSMKSQNLNKLKKAGNFQTLLQRQSELLSRSQFLSQQIADHNVRVAENRIQNAYRLIGEVEGRLLDRQQIICIVKEAHNHLVIAGAGTGKTTTIVGKIKYLLKTGKYKPQDILVLSFTNASASEMRKRIHAETSCNIEASTFHKLGMNIITKANGIVPNITRLDMRSFIKEQLRLNMKSDYYLSLLNTYLLYSRTTAKSEFDFKTKAEYDEYLNLNPPTTLKNETVKSYGEMDIANFLTQNGINYVYEKPYEADTRTVEYAQYIPDFYLPDFNIYIEYFGINRNGDVPSYFKASHGMNASESYYASMEWKRNLHRTNHTTMIECYAYEKFEGNLLENLKEKLIKASVSFTPKTSKELWEDISSKDKTVLDGVSELFETIINLAKSNQYTIEALRQLNAVKGNIFNNNIILCLLEPIYNKYCSYLSEHNEIDFNDMINNAIQYIEQKKYINSYKCIIVDEYQDISKARYSLLKAMRSSNDYDLFCVGDDWQSIYRFAGSDIEFILNFSHYWGTSEFSKIETTYRFTKSLIEISGSFIMQNPLQIRKSIRGKTDNNEFALGEISGYTDKYAIDYAVKELENLPENSSVFFIGRYFFDANLLNDHPALDCQYNKVSGLINVSYHKRSDLKMSFITAHKSKGLQADYIFIINNKKSRMGFPSKIQDAAILNLLLENCDQYPYAEERRLFYVALTRARKKVYLVTVNNQESDFVIELKKRYHLEFEQSYPKCPLCGGKLLKKNGPYGEFWGCDQYKRTGCPYKKSIRKSPIIERGPSH